MQCAVCFVNLQKIFFDRLMAEITLYLISFSLHGLFFVSFAIFLLFIIYRFFLSSFFLVIAVLTMCFRVSNMIISYSSVSDM